MSEDLPAPDAAAPSPITDWSSLDLPNGWMVDAAQARRGELCAYADRWLYDLVEALGSEHGEHVQALRSICLWGWYWTAGTYAPMNPTSPPGREWAKTRWQDFNVVLGKLARRLDADELESRARKLLVDLHEGRRTVAQTLRLDRLFRDLGGLVSEYRLDVPPRETGGGGSLDVWTDREEAVYDYWLKAARNRAPRPTYRAMQHDLGMGPNTVRDAREALIKRGAIEVNPDGSWAVALPTGERIER